jgi:hypothetical protein
MNRHPYLAACLLAGMTIVGLVGAMVVEGRASTLCVLIAAAPVVLGSVCYLRRGAAQ